MTRLRRRTAHETLLGVGSARQVTTLDAMVQVGAGSILRLPMSSEEFARLGEAKFHEYYDGCLVVNPPTVRHGVAIIRLGSALWAHSGEKIVASESGWSVGPNLFIPDVMVVDAGAFAASVVTRPPPLLVVEITSHSTRSDDWGRKRDAYGSGGAEWYWIVDLDVPEIAVLENRGGRFEVVLRSTRQAILPPLDVALDPRSLGQPRGQVEGAP